MTTRKRPTYGPNIKDAPEINSLYDALSLLKPRYGAFFLIASYHSSSSASATLNAIKSGKRKTPKGEFDYLVKVRKDLGVSYLYARRLK